MILREDDLHDLTQAMQRAPGASHSRGRTVLVENLSYTTSLSGLLRQFEGFHLQEHAATLLEGVRALAEAALCAPKHKIPEASLHGWFLKLCRRKIVCWCNPQRYKSLLDPAPEPKP